MTANSTLAEHHQAAGQDVGTFHGDANRHCLIRPGQEVPGAGDHAPASNHVHGVIDHHPHQVGIAVLQDSGGHGWSYAPVQHARRQQPGRVHHIGVTGDGLQRFLNPFKLADGAAELLPHQRIGAGREAGHLAGAGAQCRQGDRAADGQALQQHGPALAQHFLAADDLIHGDKDVIAPGRTVHEHRIHGQMPRTGMDALRIPWHQHAGNADIGVATEQAVRIIHFDRQANQGRDRCQGDIALVPGDFEAQHFFTVPLAPAHNALVGNGTGIGARHRGGQGKAGGFLAAGQAGQVILFLGFGAVLHQQFAGAEGIGHHNGNRRRHTAGGNFHHDFGVCGVGKTLAALVLRNHQSEEAVFADKRPHLIGQVVVFVGNFPVVQHGAEISDGAVKKRLLFTGEMGRLRVQQSGPVRLAREQLAIPVHGARPERFLLGV